MKAVKGGKKKKNNTPCHWFHQPWRDFSPGCCPSGRAAIDPVARSWWGVDVTGWLLGGIIPGRLGAHGDSWESSPGVVGCGLFPFHPWPNFMAFKWGWSRTSILTGMMLQVIPSELCGNRRMLEHYPRWNAAASTSTEGWKRRIFC